MSINHNKQSQFELFPRTKSTGPESVKGRFFLTYLKLPLEDFVVISVGIIMSLVIAFSFGIERGKRLSKIKGPKKDQGVVGDRKQVKVQPIVEKDNADKGLQNQENVLIVDGVEVVQASVSNSAIALRKNAIKAAKALEEKDLSLLPQEKKKVDKIYTVQVASFKQKAHAEREAEHLAKLGYETSVIVKGDYLIVCVGKFASHQKARQISKGLKHRYKDCLIRSL